MFDDRRQRPDETPLRDAMRDLLRDAQRPSMWETEDDSRLFIRDLMQEAIEKQGITPEQLAQKADVPLEAINAFLAGRGDLSDSDPLTKIERALRVNLSGW